MEQRIEWAKQGIQCCAQTEANLILDRESYLLKSKSLASSFPLLWPSPKSLWWHWFIYEQKIGPYLSKWEILFNWWWFSSFSKSYFLLLTHSVSWDLMGKKPALMALYCLKIKRRMMWPPFMVFSHPWERCCGPARKKQKTSTTLTAFCGATNRCESQARKAVTLCHKRIEKGQKLILNTSPWQKSVYVIFNKFPWNWINQAILFTVNPS